MPPSEFDFIERLRRRASKPSSLVTHRSSLLHGIGDDAAVLRFAGDAVVTADMLVEDVDFRRAYAPPRLVGHKALAVSLSDVAAMGARPRFALTSVGLPREVWETSFLEEFYSGLLALARAYGVALVGGDVSRTPSSIVVDSVVVGESARGRAVTRAGARPGDRIYVTGALGGSAAGLRLLEGGARLKSHAADRREGRATKRRGEPAHKPTRFQTSAREKLLLRHLRPEPRVGPGAWLGEQRLASAMIDLSDGLSSDLAHLCRESGVGATIDASLLPSDPLVERAAIEADPLALALDGGEDFELLFTVRPRRAARLPRELGGIPLTQIGEVTDARGGITLIQNGRAQILRPSGFEHFDGKRSRR